MWQGFRVTGLPHSGTHGSWCDNQQHSVVTVAEQVSRRGKVALWVEQMFLFVVCKREW